LTCRSIGIRLLEMRRQEREGDADLPSGERQAGIWQIAVDGLSENAAQSGNQRSSHRPPEDGNLIGVI
jgi:hypothetical protein